MDAINSVSKVETRLIHQNFSLFTFFRFNFQGIFIFKNGQSIKQLRKQNIPRPVNSGNQDKQWYETFKKLWQDVERKIEVKKNLISFFLEFLRLENNSQRN